MVTAIEAVKRKYEDAIIEDHSEPMGFAYSHRELSISKVHGEVVVPKVPPMMAWFTRDHPETDSIRLSLEGNLCVFCNILPERILENRFAELVEEWRRGTGGLSSPRAIVGHPAYQQIIEMGEPAISMIFQELQENGGWWYPALRVLTGVNPVPEEAKGRPPLNREAWLDWGRRNGYL